MQKPKSNYLKIYHFVKLKKKTTESCKTAKCGTHKKCMMRGGQPKCVCAPKCKAKKFQRKRINRYSQVENGLHHAPHQSSSRSSRRISATVGSNNINNASNRNAKRHQQNYQSPHQRNQHYSIQMNADVEVIHSLQHTNNPSQLHGDKIISVIAPLSSNRSSYLNISHSHKRAFSKHAAAAATPANGRRKSLQSTTKRHLLATVHSSHSLKHRGRTNRHGSSNSSIPIDKNIVNIIARRQISSVEQHFTSKLHGHDIPYPPIDLAVSSIFKTRKFKEKYYLLQIKYEQHAGNRSRDFSICNVPWSLEVCDSFFLPFYFLSNFPHGEHSCTRVLICTKRCAAPMVKHTKANANWNDALVDKNQHLYLLHTKDTVKVSIASIHFIFTCWTTGLRLLIHPCIEAKHQKIKRMSKFDGSMQLKQRNLFG